MGYPQQDRGGTLPDWLHHGWYASCGRAGGLSHSIIGLPYYFCLSINFGGGGEEGVSHFILEEWALLPH